ncbi:hypothetical protein E2562_005283 [Oryza meyeriana var. granulata]|uniref:Uncharacterized protein n=1 Tax=Oryza meyeriana var. granulata TaxID=110450 RepID=A0A6G1EFY9_9ORYZ|nr:hypothetical protein E2562_005283 [Oryza meyeriana var. granulata]
MGEIDSGGELGLGPLGMAQSKLARAAGEEEVAALLAAAAQGTSNWRMRRGWRRVCSTGGEGMGEIDGGWELGLGPLGVAQSELARAAGGEEVTVLLAAAALLVTAAQGTSNRRMRRGWRRSELARAAGGEEVAALLAAAA